MDLESHLHMEARKESAMANPAPVTRPSLLMRVRDHRDGQAWGTFVEIYSPLVFAYCRKRGLQDEDAADVVQEVFLGVAGSIARLEYNPEQGLFRSWLLRITHRKLCDFFGSRRRHPQGSGKTAVQEMFNAQPDKQETAEWDRQLDRRLFEWAAHQVRNEFEHSTWQAFWHTAVEARSAKAVGDELGMSLGAVYVAKSRVISRLRQCIQEATDEWSS